MSKQQHIITYQLLKSIDELNQKDADLLRAAQKSFSEAYAPYSNFMVGAAVLMQDGTVFTGFNIENASYPVCICAERTALSAAITKLPHQKIISIAISYVNASGDSSIPISPCGVCRQFMYECELRNQQSISVICGSLNGEIMYFDAVKDLLPFGFNGTSLK